MQTHSEKSNAAQPTDRSRKQQQQPTSFQFADNRPVAATQRRMQDAADDNPQAENIAQFQTMADNYASEHSFPVQKKENNTGLPDNLKSGAENLSGYSLDDVKVHYNSDKPAQLQAHAYAQGSDIHIAPGQEKHLPHEAWHVVQQKQGRVKPTLQMKGKVNVNDDSSLEKEADIMGAKALQMRSDEDQGPGLADHQPGATAQRILSGKTEVKDSPAQKTTGNSVVQKASVTRNINLTGPDENATFKVYDTLHSMDVPTRGTNGYDFPERPGRLPLHTPAYVGNVISTASAKDKTAGQVASQYAAEGFQNPTDPQYRFALVYLANRENKPWEPLAAQRDELNERSVTSAASFNGFPVTGAYSLWNRNWELNGVAKTPDEIRTALARATDRVAADTAIAQAARQVSWPKSQVPNLARNAVKNIPATANYLNRFGELGYNAFAHVGDADAVSLRAPAVEGQDAPTGLFNRFDTAIAGNGHAKAISGGYRFAKRPEVGHGAPSHSSGADLAGENLMARTNQVIESTKLDTAVRGAMAEGHPMAPYYPEPNLIVAADMYRDPTVDFGQTGPEWENFRKNMVRVKAEEWLQRLLNGAPRVAFQAPDALLGTPRISSHYNFPAGTVLPAEIPRVVLADGRLRVEWNDQRILAVLRKEYPLQDESKDAFAFDPQAALVTDVGRFDDEYIATSGAGDGHAGTDYVGGEVDPLALFDQRAAQSHAKTRSVLAGVSKIYDLAGQANQDWIMKVIKVMLPQTLFSDLSGTRELDHGEEATKAAATQRSVSELQRVQPQLQHYAAFTQLVSNLINDPAQLNARANELRLARIGVMAGMNPSQDLIRQDKVAAVRYILEARGLNGGFVALIREGEDQEAMQIWEAATDGTTPTGFADIVAMVKSVGDAIAEFLRDYGG
jgi:hypothetical protein